MDEDNIDYSEEEIDEIGDEVSAAAAVIEPKITAPKSFEDLNAMYRPAKNEDDTVDMTLTKPKEESKKENEKDRNDSEIGVAEKEGEFDEEIVDDDEEEDEDDDELEDDEELDDGEDEISDVDDDDLMKRLDSKYGKLPADADVSEDEEEDAASEASDDKWTSIYIHSFN